MEKLALLKQRVEIKKINPYTLDTIESKMIGCKMIIIQINNVELFFNFYCLIIIDFIPTIF
jgi:hypothetical protein